MRISLSLMKAFAAVAVLAVAASALAQGQGGGGGRNRGNGGGFGGGRGGNNPLTLLQAEPVQKELELSDDQKTSVTKLADDARQNRQGGGGGGNQMTQEERQTQRDDQMKKIDAILLPNQQARFDEILLQLQGAQAFSDAKVQEKLQLTDDQKKQITDLATDYRQKMRDAMGGGGGGGGGVDRTAMTQLQTEQTDKAMAILTADQKDQFTKMEGKKFDVDRATLFGGRNGGGRNRGNGGGGNGGGGNGNGGGTQPNA